MMISGASCRMMVNPPPLSGSNTPDRTSADLHHGGPSDGFGRLGMELGFGWFGMVLSVQAVLAKTFH